MKVSGTVLNLGRSISPLSLIGIFIVVLATTNYAYAQDYMHFLTPERASIYQQWAHSYLMALVVGIALVTSGPFRTLTQRKAAMRNLSSVPLTPGWIIPHLFTQRKYSLLFVISSFLYGLFYSIITSIIVYQPSVNFSEVYLAQIPSVKVIPCCGPPLYTPVTTVYLTEHLGLLLIPLSLILLIIVSTLVGLNLTLTSFAYRNRLKKGGKGLFGGLGAIVGLFTGCPTCAGLFLANIVGGAGATTFATLLSYYQPLFIGVSIPVLLATLFLIAKSLSKVFTEGCIILGLGQ